MLRMTILLIVLAFVFPTLAIDGVVYQFRGPVIWGGALSDLAEFQKRVNKELQVCGQAGIQADGAYGNGTHQAIQKLWRCPGFEQFANSEGKVTFAFWDKLFGGDKLYPTVVEQSLTLTLSHIGSDFTRFSWDDGVLVWGPFRARVGRRINQIGEIMEAVITKHPDMVRDVFGRAFSSLRRFNRARGRQALEYLDSRNHEDARALLRGLQEVAKDPRTRQVHIDYVIMTDRFYRPSIDNILDVIGDAHITEIDYAFALDLGTSIGMNQRQKDELLAEIDQVPNITSAQVRRLIAQKITDRNDHQRISRNVAYYIDELESSISTSERQLWQNWSKMKASDLGLRDIRYEPYL